MDRSQYSYSTQDSICKLQGIYPGFFSDYSKLLVYLMGLTQYNFSCNLKALILQLLIKLLLYHLMLLRGSCFKAVPQLPNSSPGLPTLPIRLTCVYRCRRKVWVDSGLSISWLQFSREKRRLFFLYLTMSKCFHKNPHI